MAELVSLQRTVISILHAALASDQLDPSGTILASDARRTGAIGALAQQFQRMAFAAPILPTLAGFQNRIRSITSRRAVAHAPATASAGTLGPLPPLRVSHSTTRRRDESLVAGLLPKPRQRPRGSSVAPTATTSSRGQLIASAETLTSPGPLPKPRRTT